MSASRTYFFVSDGYQPLDLAGPLSVFATANDFVRDGYDMLTVGFNVSPVTPNAGPQIIPDASIHELEVPHTFVIVGGPGMRTLKPDAENRERLCRIIEDSQRIVTICTGAFLAAELGILNGRMTTTHWRHEEDLSCQFPNIRIDADKLYTVDGNIWSSAGVTAGIDLALALVRYDHGDAVAAQIARQLVVYLHRDGGQTQYADGLRIQIGAAGEFSGLIEWVRNNLSADLSNPALAVRMGMSERNFQRRFKQQFGSPAASLIERLRVEQACQILTRSASSVSQVSQLVGFSNPDSFRRAFTRNIGVSPYNYQERFKINA
ncbi:MAG: helix-turn-helix domain-containing protein [Pseudomonadota bacterium]